MKKGREGNNWRCGWGGVGMVRLNWEAGIRRCTFHFGTIMMVLRDVNNTDIFRPYSNSMQSGRVFYPSVFDSEYSISITDPYLNTKKLHFYNINIHYNLIR